VAFAAIKGEKTLAQLYAFKRLFRDFIERFSIADGRITVEDIQPTHRCSNLDSQFARVRCHRLGLRAMR
jgi:hypothetical protein